jgi:hypothetical protein
VLILRENREEELQLSEAQKNALLAKDSFAHKEVCLCMV